MSAPPNCSLAESIALLPESDRKQILAGLTDQQAEAALYDWRGVWARPNQIIPPGNWRYWLLLAGRGFGKTRTGGETIREWARDPLPAPIHLVAPTAADIRGVMIEGPSGLLSCYPSGRAPLYEPSRRHKLTWPNGNVAYGFSADEPERLRGPQCCRFWADELAAWRFVGDAWDNLMFGFRIGDDLRGIITTTPKPIDAVKELCKNPATYLTRASTYENRANLAQGFFDDIIRKYEGTRLGRQELLAEILEDVPGALWTAALIDASRIKLQEIHWDLLTRVVVAIDPAVTASATSDETGIVVAALTRSQHVIILDDQSCRESPSGWAKRAIASYQRWQCDRIIGEVNNGGDLVAANIRAIDPLVPFRAVHASRGKKKRAEPVAALYEQCVGRGSVIQTTRGVCPIENVRTGDYVWTRQGARRVQASVFSGWRDTVRIRSQIGDLVCTPDHRIFTKRGWLRADALAPRDIIVAWDFAGNARLKFIKQLDSAVLAPPRPDGKPESRCASSWSSRACGIFSRLMDIIERVGIKETNFCIEQFIDPLTDQFLMAAMSTTGMGAGPITDPVILWRSVRQRIKQSIPGSPTAQSSESGFLNSSWRGGETVSQWLAFAKNAAESLNPWQPVCDFVHRPATLDTGMLSVTSGPESAVFDLQVEEAEEFFADGILVHNCRVHHVGYFAELERQMCEWTPQSTEEQHDDRMDALVWAVTELLLDPEKSQATVGIGDVTQYRISPI